MTDNLSQVKARFVQEGVSIADWAKSKGFGRVAVYRVLSGKVKGTRGKSHEIAVALGIKPAPTAPQLLPRTNELRVSAK